MTDREQDQAEALAEREQALLDADETFIRRPVGEELDPDSLRVVPPVDEDGNLVEDTIPDDLEPDE